MSAYYNEHDPKVAAWLRELIKRNLIAPGDVDERSILDVRPDDLADYTQCHFFAGIGVWSYALRQAGWPDDRPVWTGSCPCQPFSAAGKGGGFSDERHLWPAWHHLIRERKPITIFGEQVTSPVGRAWLDLVSADLEAEGYTVGALDLCAAGFGAPHIRQRFYFVADASGARTRENVGELWGVPLGGGTIDGHPHTGRREVNGFWRDADWIRCRDGRWRPVEPGSTPLVAGAAARVGRLRGYGNAINAETARHFIAAYMGRI